MDLLDLENHADGMESEVHQERPLENTESLHTVDHNIEAVDHMGHMGTGDHNLHIGLDTGHYTSEADVEFPAGRRGVG